MLKKRFKKNTKLSLNDFFIRKKLHFILLVIILILLLIWGIQIEYIALGAIFYIISLFVLDIKFVSKFFEIIKKSILGRKLQTALLVIALILMVMWKQDVETIILWMLFLSFLLYEWENRIIAGLALISLASCPFLLIYEKEDMAEIMAIYAYYFLVMTVILQIVELKRHPEEESESQKSVKSKVYPVKSSKAGAEQFNRVLKVHKVVKSKVLKVGKFTLLNPAKLVRSNLTGSVKSEEPRKEKKRKIGISLDDLIKEKEERGK